MKLLSHRVHAYTDYVLVLSLLVAPTLLGFGHVASNVSYAVAAAHLAITLLTNYRLGLVKRIPFAVHLGIETVAGVALVVAPWLFGFSAVRGERNFFLLAGIAALALSLSPRIARRSAKREAFDRYSL